jgi:hypothetical protein
MVEQQAKVLQEKMGLPEAEAKEKAQQMAPMLKQLKRWKKE